MKRVRSFTLKDKVDENGNVVEKGKKIVVRMPQKKVFEAIKEIPDMDEDNATAEDTVINEYLDEDGEFIQLQDGTNTLTYTADEGTNYLSVSVYYRISYLGV